MKGKILSIVFLLLSVKAISQHTVLTFSGGYASAKIEDNDNKATGWRINGLYEYMPAGTKFAHGLSIGYTSVSTTKTFEQTTTKSTISSVPIYYAPKYMFGKDKLKGFIKGAIGIQFSNFKRETLSSFTKHDFGFYGGGGAGIMVFLKDNIFLNGEYEIAWASNNYYKDGWISSVQGGIGFVF